MKGFLIAAPSSGSGKTTIARGLMALFVERGLKVQPFKCGPDYIDTKFHAAVCGRPSVNLDTFMATPSHVRQLFHRYGKDADVCIVEGMMGLFDGFDRDRGSSAEIAQVLGIPVVLVVDARSAAYSLTPLLSGFLNFRKDVKICGVIFNKVGSERHRQMLRQVCDDLGIQCLGYIPKESLIEQGSRYLGLDFSEIAESQQLVELLKEHLDIDSLLQLSYDAGDLGETVPENPVRYDAGKISVARNAESFSFLYQEMIDRFTDVSFFDPETEVPMLDDVSLLYLPGGYPEKHLEALVGNEETRRAIFLYAEKGGRVLAECGGMMYLCDKIVTDGGDYPMCGVLPYVITARKADRRLSLGYRRFMLDGQEFFGHEFHYTQFLGETPKSMIQVYNALGKPVDTPVFQYKNVLASYTHLYAGLALNDK